MNIKRLFINFTKEVASKEERAERTNLEIGRDFIACITHSVPLRPYFEYSLAVDRTLWIQSLSFMVTLSWENYINNAKCLKFIWKLPRNCHKLIDIYPSDIMSDVHWTPKLNGCEIVRLEPWKLQFTAFALSLRSLPNQFFFPENTS